MTQKTPQEILSITLDKNDANANTIGQYLFTLTRKVWDEEETFSGYRPFGNSGWTDTIIHALILNDVISGELDEYGRVDDFNLKQLNEVMSSVFDFLYNADYSSIKLPPAPKDHHIIELGSTWGISNAILNYDEDPMSKETAEGEAKLRNESGHYEGTWIAVKLV